MVGRECDLRSGFAEPSLACDRNFLISTSKTLFWMYYMISYTHGYVWLHGIGKKDADCVQNVRVAADGEPFRPHRKASRAI